MHGQYDRLVIPMGFFCSPPCHRNALIDQILIEVFLMYMIFLRCVDTD